MRLRELPNEDDAVSPVIGVILMVAITVILAAVIASFVLGLGGDSDVQPTTSLSFDYDATDEEIRVTVSSGDSLDPSEVYIRGELGGDGNTTSVNENLASIVDVSGIDNAEESLHATHVGVASVGGLDFTDDQEGGVESDIASGQGIIFTVDSAASIDSLDESDFDVVWDTGDDSATLGGFEGPEA